MACASEAYAVSVLFSAHGLSGRCIIDHGGLRV